MNTWNLQHKKALITGGTKGIGKAAVREFLELGADVLFTARNGEEVMAWETELRKTYAGVFGIVADSASKEGLLKIRDWVSEHWGRLDVLVNNTGTNLRKPSIDYTHEEYNTIIHTNLTAVFDLSVLLYGLLKKSSDSVIVNVASVAGIADVKTGSPYGISKAGLLQLTRNLAVEWAEAGIRVNAVSPWFTATPLTAGLLADEDKVRQVITRTPLRRVARPEEIARAIAFLSMEAAAYITGHNIVVDGGMSATAL